MRPPFALLAALALLAGLRETTSATAQTTGVYRPMSMMQTWAQNMAGRDVNCQPTRSRLLAGAPQPVASAYPGMYYPRALPPYGLMPASYGPAPDLGAAVPMSQPTPAASPSSLPTALAGGMSEKKIGNDAPAEPPVRLRFVELTVTGLRNAADRDKLTEALDKMKASRGATVKRQGDEATVKVWYSEKDPLAAADVVQAVVKLGFTAAAPGS